MVLGNYPRAGFGDALQRQVKSPSLITIPPTPLPCTRIMPASCSPHFSSHASKAEDKPSIWDSRNLSISITCSESLHFCDLETYQPKGKEWIHLAHKINSSGWRMWFKTSTSYRREILQHLFGILEILVFFFSPFSQKNGNTFLYKMQCHLQFIRHRFYRNSHSLSEWNNWSEKLND